MRTKADICQLKNNIMKNIADKIQNHIDLECSQNAVSKAIGGG